MDYQQLENEVKRLRLENSRLVDLCGEKRSPKIVVTNPTRVTNIDPSKKTVCLSGPISNEKWQTEIIKGLKETSVYIFNSQRDDWQLINPIDTIPWEFEHVEKCGTVLFWFSWDHPNICNTLLELGRCTTTKPYIFIGVHSKNQHREYIIEFIRAFRPNIRIYSTLEQVSAQLFNWLEHGIEYASSK